MNTSKDYTTMRLTFEDNKYIIEKTYWTKDATGYTHDYDTEFMSLSRTEYRQLKSLIVKKTK